MFNSENLTTKSEDSYSAVYKITNRLNGMIYVGSAKSFHMRFSSYKNCERHDLEGGRIYRAIRKYGFSNFTFEILEVVSEPSRLIEREQYWMDALTPFDGIGYNICRVAGSCLGKRHTDDAKRKMSITKTGMILDDQWRENLSKSAQARRHEISKQKSKPVVQIDSNTLSVISEFPSARSASKSFGREKDTSIGRACTGFAISAHGYYWAFKTDYDKRGFIPRKPRQASGEGIMVIRPVYQFRGGGYTMWDSATDAARALGVFSSAKISEACRKGNIAHKSRWSFVDDPEIIQQVRDRRLRQLAEKTLAEDKLAA